MEAENSKLDPAGCWEGSASAADRKGWYAETLGSAMTDPRWNTSPSRRGNPDQGNQTEKEARRSPQTPPPGLHPKPPGGETKLCDRAAGGRSQLSLTEKNSRNLKVVFIQWEFLGL